MMSASRVRKWLIIAAAGLAVLVIALSVACRIVLSKNFLAARIEAALNCRVEIGELHISLLSIPAKVVIGDVILAQRDDVVRDGVAHDDRPPLEGGEIRAKEIRFHLSLRDLLSKKIEVSDLLLRGAHFDLKLSHEGELNIDPLFESPKKEKKERKRKGLNARDGAPFVTRLKRLRFEDAAFDLLIEKTGLMIQARDLNLDLSDIQVDPNALEKVNEARLQLAVQLGVFSSRQDRPQYAQIGLEGPARVRLFDPATGELSPDADIDFAIDPASYVSAKARYIVELWKVTDELVKIGLKTGLLSDTLSFGRERVLSASYAHNKLLLRKPLSLTMNDWELVLEDDSWLVFSSEQHASMVRLVAATGVSDFVRKHLLKLIEITPEAVRDKLKAELLGPVFVDDRLTLKVATRGELSDPKVKLITSLPDAQKTIKEYAKTKLMDLLLDQLGN